MIASAFLFISIIQILVLSGLFFILYKTIKSPGLQKLNRFTVILLAACVVIFFLPLIKINLIDLYELLPARLITRLNQPLALTIAIGLLIFFIIAILKLWKGGNAEILFAVWIVLAVVNILELILQSLVVFSYTNVVGEHGETLLDLMTIKNQLFLVILIKPFVSPLSWIIISSISLSKITREKRAEAQPALS